MNIQLSTPILCALVFLLAAGCRDTERNSQSQQTGGKAGDSRSSRNADDIFAEPRVLSFSIEISSNNLEVLRNNEDSHAYVSCTVREGSRAWDDVGIHCRGNPAKELATGKPDWIVTFDKFASGQRFHGQRRVILQASREDPSYLAAPISLEMFRAAGVPAPRCTFARVQLNDQPLGLYVMIEGVEREFMSRNFGTTDGNLYDEGRPPDITGKLEKSRGKNRKDQSDVDALAAAALLPNPAERWKQLQRQLDMESFLKFTALEVLLWQDDSYSLEASKFRLFHHPETDRFIFFPKCVERVLKKTTGPVVPECRGVVARAVLNTKEGEQQYRETVAKMLETTFEPSRVRARARALADIIRPVLAENGGRDAQTFEDSVAQFLADIEKRAEFASAQLKSSQSR